MGVKGFVETLTPQQAGGWACDQNNLDIRCEIAVMLKGGLLAQTVADKLRPDLQQAGFGTGEFGFVARFPLILSYAELDAVEVFVVGIDGKRQRLNHFRERPTFKAKPGDPDSRPVFILGSRRSGTSAVTHALLRYTRYRGSYEGHFFDLLAPLLNTVKEFYSYKTNLISDPNMISTFAEVPRDYFDSVLADIFRDLAAKMFAVPFWLDKTPTRLMIQAAPSLGKIWPEARFIFLRRRAYESLQSHRRKFPEKAFEDHCRWWSSCMSAWLDVREELGGRAIEIDQYLLAHDPSLAASLIAETLSLEPSECKKVGAFLTWERPERTEVELNKIESGVGEDWNEEEKRTFEATCLPWFAPFGYAETTDYFVSGDISLAWRRI